MAIYDAKLYEGSQSVLHELFDGENISRAYRKINRYLEAKKERTLEILMPAPKKIIEDQPVAVEYGGDCCAECGSTKLKQSGTCKTCELCGYAGGCG